MIGASNMYRIAGGCDKDHKCGDCNNYTYDKELGYYKCGYNYNNRGSVNQSRMACKLFNKDNYQQLRFDF